MSARRLAPLACLAMAMLGGCAHAPGLEIGYPDAAANRSLLASVGSRRVVIPPVSDARLEPARIGVKTPSNGKSDNDFVTTRPVGDIVRDAVATEMAANGHAVVAGHGDVVLPTQVEEFWLDVVHGRSTTQYVGKVVFVLTVLDGRTGDQLVSHRYIATKREEVEHPSDDAARAVMDAALSRTMHDVATDPTIVAAFARATAAATPR